MINAPAPIGRRARGSQRQQGYSLVELIVGLTVTVIVLGALFQVFQSNTKIARAQTDIADMQQSLRVAQNQMARLVRMAGRGGLAPMIDNGAALPLLPAVVVRDDVAAGANVAVGDASSPEVAEGTDVLTIRGVFNTPVYQLNFADPTTLVLRDAGGGPTTDATQAVTGTLRVTNPSPAGIPQDLTPLCDAIAAGTPEPLVVVSPIDDSVYAVVELTSAAGSGCAGAPPNLATVTFAVQGGTHTGEYRNLYRSGVGPNPVLPSGLTNAAYVGILEEYRFYVREPAPDTTPAPALSMARMFPATEGAYQGNPTEMQIDIADNVLDLQVALGFDSSLGEVLVDRNGDGNVDENDIVVTETDDGQDDDWLFNSDQDDPTQAPWVPPWDDDPGSATPPQPELYYLRLNTIVRVQVPERNFQAPEVARVENRDVDPFNTVDERRFRRRLMQTTIDLRNL